MKQAYPIHALHLRYDTDKILWHHHINTSTKLSNILMNYQSSATLHLNYLINSPPSSKLRFPKIYLAMGLLVFPHNHIKVSWLIFPSMVLTLNKVTKLLFKRESILKTAGYWSYIISMEWSMDMQEFPKILLLPGSGIYWTSINLLVTTHTSTWIKGVNY